MVFFLTCALNGFICLVLTYVFAIIFSNTLALLSKLDTPVIIDIIFILLFVAIIGRVVSAVIIA